MEECDERWSAFRSARDLFPSSIAIDIDHFKRKRINKIIILVGPQFSFFVKCYMYFENFTENFKLQLDYLALIIDNFVFTDFEKF